MRGDDIRSPATILLLPFASHPDLTATVFSGRSPSASARQAAELPTLEACWLCYNACYTHLLAGP